MQRGMALCIETRKQDESRAADEGAKDCEVGKREFALPHVRMQPYETAIMAWIG